MNTCDKPCIANIDGVCVAEQCEGPITRHPDPPTDAKTAAKFYRLAPGEVCSLWGEWNAMMRVLNSIGSYDRLRELAEADKEGRAVILPCKVGSTVYTEFCDEVVEKCIGQFHVNSYTEPRLWADIDCDWTSTQCVRWDLAVGKTVFLTREEAEAALKEVQNGNKTDM